MKSRVWPFALAGQVAPLALVLTAAVFVSGCAEQDQITRYKVPNADSKAAGSATNASNVKAGEPAQMLAAIAFEGEISWFFKLTGKPDAVEGVKGDFKELLKSIEFEAAQPYAKPKWSLPEGWTAEMSEGGIRFATITVPTDDEPMELSVIPLPTSADQDEWLLSNINRWRGQLSLDGLKSAALESATESIEYTGGAATFVEIKGKQQASGMSRGMGAAPFAPFAGGNRPGPAPTRPAARPPAQSPAEKPNTEVPAFATPDGWTKSENDRFSAMAYDIGDGEDAVRFTVTRLGAAAADLLPNVNRWRRQVGLKPLDQGELATDVEDIEIGGQPASYIKAVGETKSILGAIQVRGGAAWYFKLIGKPEPTEAQRERLEQIFASIKYTSE